MIEQSSLNKFKNFLESKSHEIIKISDDISKLQIENPTIGNIQENFDSIKETILDGVDKINKRLKKEIKLITWDKLCIGFFGETNAGKSTLIEALIKGDGSSIGDGRKDFTRKVKHLSYKNLELIDMPGIEGNEQNVQTEIEKAVSRAHLIFYVITSNKEPERLTLQKIKNYLGNKIKIYLIINKRCDISAFKHNISLEDENIKKIIERTQNHMHSVFGNKYCGYLLCHAMLGYYASGEPRNDVLKKTKEKALNIFENNTKKMFALSGLSNIEELIKTTQKDINYIIISSNSMAIIKDISFILSNILKNKKEFDKNIKSFQESFEKKKEELLNFLSNAKNSLIKKIYIIIESKKKEIYEIISDGIEKNHSKTEISDEIRKYERDLEQTLKTEIELEMKKIMEEFNKIVEELKKRFELQVNLSFKMKLDIDISNILKKLNISIGSILKNTVSIVESIISIIIARFTYDIPLLITGIVSGIASLWNWFFIDPKKRKNKAKQEAYRNVNKNIDETKKQISQKITSEFSKKEKQVKSDFYNIYLQFKGLRSISSEFNSYILNLKRTKAEISGYLLRLLTNKNVNAYIDTVGNDQFLAIIGTNQIEDKILDMLSIDKGNVFYFERLEDFNKSLDSISQDSESRDKKLEFLHRAGEAFGLSSFLCKPISYSY